MNALGRKMKIGAPIVEFSFNTKPVKAVQGQSIASALVSAGILAQRVGRNQSEHGHYCGMGTCYECLVTIDGVSGQRSCITPVRSGISIESQSYHSNPVRESSGPDSVYLPEAELSEVDVEVLIVGAGPAGLEAALAARRAGAEVMLIDERSSLGGQYFKQLSSAYTTEDQQAPDRQMQWGRELASEVRDSGVTIRTETLVWGAFQESEADIIQIGIEHRNQASLLRPKALVVATGATERPYPVPGWTLPGVMTTGGLQTLLRSYRSAPPGPIVVAGHGPLNLQVAAELMSAGAAVAAVVESGRPFSLSGLVYGAKAAYRGPKLIAEGVGYLWMLRRKGVPIIYGHAVAAIHGKEVVESVELAPVNNDGSLGESRRTITASAVGLGYGFLPQAEITRLLGVAHNWDGADSGWISAVREDDGSCSIPSVFVAGEAGGFGGAHIAMAQGHLAGLAAARYCGHEAADATEPQWRRQLDTHKCFQDNLWSAFQSPLRPLASVTPETIICRCEDVSASEIYACIDQGSDFGAVKRRTRAGMGRCQGRYCAATVRNLLADRPLEATELDLPAPQNPIKPLSAGIIAVEKGEWGGHKRVMPEKRHTQRAASGKNLGHRQADVIVIGAGIAGVSTALHLARAGIDVVVIDCGVPNNQASGGNAGSLHVQLLSFDYGRKAEVGGGPAAQALPLQQASAILWGEWAGELDTDIEFKRTGGLMVAETEQQMGFLKKKASLERSLGIDTQVIGSVDVRSLIPYVSKSVVGGAWCSEEGKINPLLATPALVDIAIAAGARFYTGEVVQSLLKTGNAWQVHTNLGTLAAGKVVNAAGAWAGSIAALAGIKVPVYGAPLQMIVTEASEPLVDVLLAHADRHLTLKQATNGNVIIGGGWPAGVSRPYGQPRPSLDSLEGNLWVAHRVLPPVKRLQVLRSWAAMNVNIDGAPILGEVPSHPGFYNAVTSNGYTLGPMVGRITADLIQRGACDWSLEPFSLERFNGGLKL